MENKDTFDQMSKKGTDRKRNPLDFLLNAAKNLIDKEKGSLENKEVPLLPLSSDSSFLGDKFIPGPSYEIDHSNLQLNCPSIAMVSKKGKGLSSMESGFAKQVKNIPIVPIAKRRNLKIEENIQTPNTNEDDLVKTFLQQSKDDLGIGCLVHYVSMNLIVHMLIKEFKDYKENFEKTNIKLHDLQEKYMLLVSNLEEKEEELKKSRDSTQSVLESTLKFSNKIIMHSSRVKKSVEEAQKDISDKFTNFENKFKEKAARDEEETKDQISTILANFKSKSVAMVSEAFQIMQDAYLQQSTMLQEEMVKMKEFSEDAREKLTNM